MNGEISSISNSHVIKSHAINSHVSKSHVNFSSALYLYLALFIGTGNVFAQNSSFEKKRENKDVFKSEYLSSHISSHIPTHISTDLSTHHSSDLSTHLSEPKVIESEVFIEFDYNLEDKVKAYYLDVLKENEKIKQGLNTNLDNKSSRKIERQKMYALFLDKQITNYNNLLSDFSLAKDKHIIKINDARCELVDYFSSDYFFNGLVTKYDNEELAKTKQAKLIENVLSAKVFIKTLDDINNEIPNAIAIYKINEHKILVPIDTLKKETILHEFIHAAYLGDEELSRKEKRNLVNSYKQKISKNNRIFAEKYDMDPRAIAMYNHPAPERIVRKTLLEMDIINYNIKSSSEEFTDQHYDSLLKLVEKKQLFDGSVDFLFHTKKAKLKQIMTQRYK